MALNGIDISNYQAGIDLSAVDCDFAICKATEGTGYTSDDYQRQVNQCREIGLLYGTYHYVSGGDATAEADYYVDTVSDTIGDGALAIDWESGGNSAWGDTDYLSAVIARVIERTGVVPILYASASAYPWEVADEYGCPKWVAQYASNDATGYQDSPWNEGAYDCEIRQYSSSGAIDGYSGRLDINKYYGDAASWRAMAGGKSTISDMEDLPMTAILWYEGQGYLLDSGRFIGLSDLEECNVLKACYQKINGADIPEFDIDQNWRDRLTAVYGLD